MLLLILPVTQFRLCICVSYVWSVSYRYAILSNLIRCAPASFNHGYICAKVRCQKR